MGLKERGSPRRQGGPRWAGVPPPHGEGARAEACTTARREAGLHSGCGARTPPRGTGTTAPPQRQAQRAGATAACPISSPTTAALAAGWPPGAWGGLVLCSRLGVGGRGSHSPGGCGSCLSPLTPYRLEAPGAPEPTRARSQRQAGQDRGALHPRDDRPLPLGDQILAALGGWGQGWAWLFTRHLLVWA